MYSVCTCTGMNVPSAFCFIKLRTVDVHYSTMQLQFLFFCSPFTFQDTSPTGSPPLVSPTYTTSALKLGGHVFMCFMLVMCFFVDPLSLMSGANEVHVAHGSQRTLSSVGEDDVDMEFTLGWFFMWTVRLFLAGLCFGWVWLHSIPVHNPEWEGVRFWRLRNQAEKDIKSVSCHININLACKYIHVCFSQNNTLIGASLIQPHIKDLESCLFVGVHHLYM